MKHVLKPDGGYDSVDYYASATCDNYKAKIPC